MTPVSGVIFSISIALGVHLTTFCTNLSRNFPRMAGLVLATWSLEGAEGKFIKLLRKSIKITTKIAISHSGITPLLRSFLRLRRPAETSAGRAGETLPLPHHPSP